MSDASKSTASYVYGIVPSEAKPTLSGTGVEGGAFRTVVCGRLAAIVSGVRSVPVRATRGNLMAHSDVLQEAVQTATVLPMRFGFVIEDDDAVREELLESRREELEGLLAKVGGRVEMTVKAYYLEDALLRTIVQENRAIAELRDVTQKLPGDAGYYKRIELGERIVSAIEGKRQEDASLLRRRLDRLAFESAYEVEIPERMVLKAALLVERGRVPALRELVAKLAEERSHTMQFTCVGPLPPYSFVQFAPRAEAVASTS